MGESVQDFSPQYPKEKLQQTPIKIQPLSADFLEKTSMLATKVFSSDVEDGHSPETAFRGSLFPGQDNGYFEAKGISTPQYFIALDESKNDVLGVVGLYSHKTDSPETAWLGWFCVDPNTRNQGVGQKLLEFNEEQARQRGIKTIKIWTSDVGEESNAQGLYEKMGYVVERTEPGKEGEFTNIYRTKNLQVDNNNMAENSVDIKEESVRKPIVVDEYSNGKRLATEDIRQFQGDQPAVSRIIELASGDSSWRRSNLLGRATELVSREDESKKFNIEVITDPESADLMQYQKIMEETFGPEEVDPIEYAKAGILGKKPSGEKDACKYQILVLKEGNNVIALHGGGALDIKNDQGEPTGDMVYMVGYAVTKPEYIRRGFARELYTSALIGAVSEAESQGKKLVGIIGETTSASKIFLESVKRRRVYVEGITPDGNRELTEVPYLQPALEFNDKGDPAEDAGESPEHLMVDMFNSETPTKDKLMQMVKSMYEWCNYWSVSDFEYNGVPNEQAVAAHQNHVAYVKGVEHRLEDFLNSHGDLCLIKSDEKDRLISQGVSVKSYDDADKSDNEET